MKCVWQTPSTLRWLQESNSVQILHIFERVINLVNDHDEVLSIVTPEIGPGPFSLVVEGELPPGIIPDVAVRIDPLFASLCIGQISIETSNARVWNPIPEWTKYRNIEQQDQEIRPPLADDLAILLDRLLQSILDENEAACRKSVHALAGLGQGLTPSGDDILIGVLYGLCTWQADRIWQRIIVETAVPRTTTLSAAYLRAARNGEAINHWHDLVDGEPGAVQRILDMGHRSGAEALAGFWRTVDYLR